MEKQLQTLFEEQKKVTEHYQRIQGMKNTPNNIV